MTGTKPYLIRAIHEWCADHGFTPYLSVVVDGQTRVPREFVRDGQIVLNVGMEATHQLNLGNDEITFQARFGGKTFAVFVPVVRVSAIYARENGQGMGFEVEETPTTAESPADSRSDASDEAPGADAGTSPGDDDRGVRRAHLKVIK